MGSVIDQIPMGRDWNQRSFDLIIIIQLKESAQIKIN